MTCDYLWSETKIEFRYVKGVPYSLITSGGAYTGGIAGFAVDSAYFDEEGNTIRIEKCKNTGKVTGSTYTGGVLGVGKNVHVEGCLNKGTVDEADTFDSDTIRPYIGIVSYTIRFDANGGKLKPEDTLKLAAFGVMDNLPEPTRKGYSFDGWKYEDMSVTEETTYSDLISYKPTSMATLKAQWTAVPASATSEAKDGQPGTGDYSMIWLWSVLLFVSGTGIAGVTIHNRRIKNE